MEEKDKKDRSKKIKSAGNETFMDRVVSFWKGVKGEFKKIIWPTRDQLMKQTAAVLVVSVILGAFIRIYDLLCQYVISFIK